MSTRGCGFLTTFGDAAVTCGTYLGLGELLPVLCPACNEAWATAQLARRARGPADWCASCSEHRPEPGERDCASCLQTADLCGRCGELPDRCRCRADDGEAGSRCSAGCGYCGRCGGA